MKKNDFKNHNLTSANVFTNDIYKAIQGKTAYDKNIDILKQGRMLLNKINHNNENIKFDLEQNKETKEITAFVATFDKDNKRQVFLNSRTAKEQQELMKRETIQKLLKNNYVKDLINETAFTLNEKNIVFYKMLFYFFYKISNLKINTETNLFENNKIELSIKELIDNNIFTSNYKHSANSFYEFFDKISRIQTTDYYYNTDRKTISVKKITPFGNCEYEISLYENLDKIIFYIPNDKDINLVKTFKNKLPYCSWQNEIRTNLTFKIHILIQSLAIQRIDEIKTDGYFTIKLLNIASLINFEKDLNSLKITKDTSKEDKLKLKRYIFKAKQNIMKAIRELQTYSKNDYEIEVIENKQSLYSDFIKYLEETSIKIKPINKYLTFFKNFKYRNETDANEKQLKIDKNSQAEQ